jgi:excisionase family DNA binding protein
MRILVYVDVHRDERTIIEMRATVEAEYFNYPEAAKYTGLSRTYLWRLVESGEIRASRLGRAVRISRKDLDAFMSSRAA